MWTVDTELVDTHTGSQVEEGSAACELGLNDSWPAERVPQETTATTQRTTPIPCAKRRMEWLPITRIRSGHRHRHTIQTRVRRGRRRIRTSVGIAGDFTDRS